MVTKKWIAGGLTSARLTLTKTVKIFHPNPDGGKKKLLPELVKLAPYPPF